MMDQFVMWEMRGVRYLGLRADPEDSFLQTNKRLP